MTARTIVLTIISGDKRCYSEPGKPCEHVGTRRFGTVWLCRLFPSHHVAYTVLEDDKGHLLRCKACLEAEK